MKAPRSEEPATFFNIFVPSFCSVALVGSQAGSALAAGPVGVGIQKQVLKPSQSVTLKSSRDKLQSVAGHSKSSLIHIR